MSLSNFISTREAENAAWERLERDRLVRWNDCRVLVKRVVDEGVAMAENLTPNFKDFVLQLASYLDKRKDEDDDTSEIEKRSLFVTSCFNAIKDNNFDSLKLIVKEENISAFKGFFSRRFYVVLNQLQKYLARRDNVFNENLDSDKNIVLPKDILIIIKPYVDTMHLRMWTPESKPQLETKDHGESNVSSLRS